MLGAKVPAAPLTSVVLVCRCTARGAWSATGAVEQWRRGACPPGVRVLGVVAVDASPRRPPRLATERLYVMRGWVPYVWRFGWVEELLAADEPRDVGLPPDVAALAAAVGRLIGEGLREQAR